MASSRTNSVEMPGERPEGLGWVVAVFFAVLGVTGGVEFLMGRLPLGPDGKFGFWEGDIWSSENSQRLLDPYSFSHIAHGILFFAFLWLVARRVPLRYRFCPPATKFDIQPSEIYGLEGPPMCSTVAVKLKLLSDSRQRIAPADAFRLFPSAVKLP